MLTEPISFLSPKWIGAIYSELKKLRSKKNEEIEKISNDFGDPLALAKNYIEPKCQQRNPADHHEDDEAISDVRSSVFDTINRFLNKNVVHSGGHNQLFVLADAGMGKTSLLIMIKMIHAASFWPVGYNCELFKLGPDTLSEIYKIPSSGKTVLLLDALDEDKESWGNMEKRIIEILDKTRKFRRVIISCRTQYFPEFESDPFFRMGRISLGGFVCPMIYLSLFDEQQVNKYCKRVFPNSFINKLMRRPNPKWEKVESVLSKMKSLRFRPLLLAHIEDIMESNNKEWTDYSLYNALVKIWLNREVIKLRKITKKTIDYEGLLKASILLAEYMQSNRVRSIEEKKIDNILFNNENMSFLKEFNFGGRSLMNRNSKGDYRFSHYSVQEFLVSFGMTNGMVSAENPIRVSESMLVFMKQKPIMYKYFRQLDISGIGDKKNIGGVRFYDTFVDGSCGPTMTVVPEGTYVRESNYQEADGASVAVELKVDIPFAVQEEYLIKYARENGYLNKYLEQKNKLVDSLKDLEDNFRFDLEEIRKIFDDKDMISEELLYLKDDDVSGVRNTLKELIKIVNKKIINIDTDELLVWICRKSEIEFGFLEGKEEQYFNAFIKEHSGENSFRLYKSNDVSESRIRVRKNVEFFDPSLNDNSNIIKYDCMNENKSQKAKVIDVRENEEDSKLERSTNKLRWWSFFTKLD